MSNPTLDEWHGRRGRPTFKVPTLAAAKNVVILGSSSEGPGYGATDTSGDYITNIRKQGYLYTGVSFLSDWLSIPVNRSGDAASHNNTLAQLPVIDPRVSLSAGATVNGAIQAFGGAVINLWPSNTHSETIVFEEKADTVWFIVATSNGANGNKARYSIDGGALVDAITFTDTDAHRVEVSGLDPNQAHTLVVTTPNNNANSVFLIAHGCYTSTAKEVRTLIAGAVGWSTVNWAQNAIGYNPMAAKMIQALNADVMIDAFGGNETLTGSTDLASFITRCGTFYDAVLAASPTTKQGMIIKPMRTLGGKDGSNYDTEYAIRDARISLAKSRGMPYFDVTESAGMRPLTKQNGEMQADDLHYMRKWHDRVGTAFGYWLFTNGLLF